MGICIQFPAEARRLFRPNTTKSERDLGRSLVSCSTLPMRSYDSPCCRLSILERSDIVHRSWSFRPCAYSRRHSSVDVEEGEVSLPRCANLSAKRVLSEVEIPTRSTFCFLLHTMCMTWQNT